MIRITRSLDNRSAYVPMAPFRKLSVHVSAIFRRPSRADRTRLLEIDTRRLRRGMLDWRDRELAGEASRMIRCPPMLAVKQVSERAAMSRCEKITSRP